MAKNMLEVAMRYDFYSLSLFLSVAQSGSMAQAADMHNIAASAVSRRMAELEALIGTELFYRLQRGVTLTPAGQEFLHHARDVQAHVARMDIAMQDFAEGLRGSVRLAANSSAITQFLPEDLAAFSKAYPEIRIKMEEMFSTRVVAQVRAGTADLGVCSGLTDASGVDVTLYRRDTLVLVTTKSHPLAARKKVKLLDLLDEDFVSLQDGSSIRSYVENEVQNYARPLRTRIQVLSFDGVRRMVQAGLGIAILPYGAVEQFLETENLAMIGIDEPWAERDLWIVTKPGKDLPRPATILLDYLIGARS